MRRLVCPLSVLALVTLFAPVARAAPSCRLVRDPRGDTYLFRWVPTVGVADDALDIVSADVASNARTLTAAVRVQDLDGAATTAPTGSSYELHFRVARAPQTDFALIASRSEGVETYELVVANASTLTRRDVSGAFDASRSEARVSVSLEELAEWASVRRGDQVSIGDVYTTRGVVGEGLIADEAAGGRAYRAGARSCVPIGR